MIIWNLEFVQNSVFSMANVPQAVLGFIWLFKCLLQDELNPQKCLVLSVKCDRTSWCLAMVETTAPEMSGAFIGTEPTNTLWAAALLGQEGVLKLGLRSLFPPLRYNHQEWVQEEVCTLEAQGGSVEIYDPHRKLSRFLQFTEGWKTHWLLQEPLNEI